MDTLAAIEAAAEALPYEQQEALFSFLAVRLGKQAPTIDSQTERRPGLHAGQWDVSPDFDTPLPDAFWLGNDA